jgi:hypothetical protein
MRSLAGITHRVDKLSKGPPAMKRDAVEANLKAAGLDPEKVFETVLPLSRETVIKDTDEILEACHAD